MVKLELCKWGYCINAEEGLNLPYGSTLGIGWEGLLLPFMIGFLLGFLLMYHILKNKQKIRRIYAKILKFKIVKFLNMMWDCNGFGMAVLFFLWGILAGFFMHIIIMWMVIR